TLIFFSMLPPPPPSPLFPYTTLFRSSARRARRRSRGLHALAEEEPRVEPRERHGLAVRDLERRGHRLAGDDPIRRERDLRFDARSEEHTSELQSRRDLVCRLLLEKKK